jgi:hypothetical protein
MRRMQELQNRNYQRKERLGMKKSGEEVVDKMKMRKEECKDVKEEMNNSKKKMMVMMKQMRVMMMVTMTMY